MQQKRFEILKIEENLISSDWLDGHFKLEK